MDLRVAISGAIQAPQLLALTSSMPWAYGPPACPVSPCALPNVQGLTCSTCSLPDFTLHAHSHNFSQNAPRSALPIDDNRLCQVSTCVRANQGTFKSNWMAKPAWSLREICKLDLVLRLQPQLVFVITSALTWFGKAFQNFLRLPLLEAPNWAAARFINSGG